MTLETHWGTQRLFDHPFLLHVVGDFQSIHLEFRNEASSAVAQVGVGAWLQLLAVQLHKMGLVEPLPVRGHLAHDHGG